MSATSPPAVNTPIPALDSSQILHRLLPLIEQSTDIDDFTAEALAKAMRSPGLVVGDEHFAYSGPLADGLSFVLEVDRKSMQGPRLDLTFIERPNTSSTPVAWDCPFSFEMLSDKLQRSEFAQEPMYGEQGQVIRYRFARGALQLEVTVRAADQAPVAATRRHCITYLSVQ